MATKARKVNKHKLIVIQAYAIIQRLSWRTTWVNMEQKSVGQWSNRYRVHSQGTGSLGVLRGGISKCCKC